MNIYVSNLNFRTRGESLQTLFGEYGEVSSANIITDRETEAARAASVSSKCRTSRPHGTRLTR